jgi:hypothetical protein
LQHNRVISASVSGRGPRLKRTGHWRYYSDPELIFHRISFPHEFDPLMAPEDGWGLLAEISEPAEAPLSDPKSVVSRILVDLRRARAYAEGSEIIDVKLRVIDPAYVVFTADTDRIVSEARVFLEEHDIYVVGRYGRWEYSSMAQVMRDGWQWSESLPKCRQTCEM